MARCQRRRLALQSRTDRRRMCKKRNHLRIIHRSRQYDQVHFAEEASSDAAR
ncbi:hypothetical protein [Ferrimonas gelatinilytica]|uniref:hypothetical protein n=1 Tax=Ferrimonas gelatinilytica TaxID=1255257 RepID=UPI0031EADC68